MWKIEKEKLKTILGDLITDQKDAIIREKRKRRGRFFRSTAYILDYIF